MTSVKKLVLVPKEEWDKIRLAMPKVTRDEHKEVSVQAPRQMTTQQGRGKEVKEEKADGPTPPPPPPSLKEEREGEGGKKTSETSPKVEHVDREETGKDQSSEVAKKDAGIWRPPGIPVTLRRTKGWIVL